MKLKMGLIGGVLLAMGCGGMKYKPTTTAVELPRYMGAWYVWAGRTTYVERGARNAVEKYSWNTEKDRIDVDFSFRKGDAKGKLKKLPQKAWIVAGSGNARWKVQPFWPLRLDYLVVVFDPNYEWTAVGTPNGSYLWIMGRVPAASDAKLAEIVEEVRKTGYPVGGIARVPQEW